MIKYISRLLAGTLFAVVLTVLMSGCELIKEAYEAEMEYASTDPHSDDYESRFVLAVFSEVKYPRATMLEREITDNHGESIWVNSNQHFDSKRIREARIVPRPGNPDICDLRLRLDDAGKSHWQMLVALSRGEPVVLMVDSRFIGKFIPELPRDRDIFEWVNIRIGMDSYTARGVAKFAKRNYAHFNPKASDWLSSLF